MASNCDDSPCPVCQSAENTRAAEEEECCCGCCSGEQAASLPSVPSARQSMMSKDQCVSCIVDHVNRALRDSRMKVLKEVEAINSTQLAKTCHQLNSIDCQLKQQQQIMGELIKRICCLEKRKKAPEPPKQCQSDQGSLDAVKELEELKTKVCELKSQVNAKCEELTIAQDAVIKLNGIIRCLENEKRSVLDESQRMQDEMNNLRSSMVSNLGLEAKVRDLQATIRDMQSTACDLQEQLRKRDQALCQAHLCLEQQQESYEDSLCQKDMVIDGLQQKLKDMKRDLDCMRADYDRVKACINKNSSPAGNSDASPAAMDLDPSPTDMNSDPSPTNDDNAADPDAEQ